VNREGEAERFDQMQQRIDRLNTLARRHSGIEQLHEPATAGYIASIARFVAEEEYQRASETVRNLDRLADTIDELRPGSKADEIREVLKTTTSQLLREQCLNLLEELTDALRDCLPETRWSVISSDSLLIADELLRKDEISMEDYRRVSDLFDR